MVINSSGTLPTTNAVRSRAMFARRIYSQVNPATGLHHRRPSLSESLPRTGPDRAKGTRSARGPVDPQAEPPTGFVQ